MTLARERHGIFVFSGNTRHRVEVRCLKDFEDRHFVDPSGLGFVTGGYTRLGAPLRHLTSPLLAQPSERRLLIVIGDGLMSDEGYEGRYAWADVAHAVEEADDAGVAVYYLGVGPTRVDPLPEVFGPRRSKRIRRVDELPRVLAWTIDTMRSATGRIAGVRPDKKSWMGWPATATGRGDNRLYLRVHSPYSGV